MGTSSGKRQISSGVLLSCAGILLGISTNANLPAFADEAADASSGGAPTSVMSEFLGNPGTESEQKKQAGKPEPGAELDYDKALEALQKTKAHTQEAENWERRSVPVPPGVDPRLVIEKNMIKVPGVLGLEKMPPAPDPSQIKPLEVKITPKDKAPQAKSQEAQGGWESLSQDESADAHKDAGAIVQQDGSGKPTKSTMTTVFDLTKDAASKTPKTQPVSLNSNEVVDLGDDETKPSPLRSSKSLSQPAAPSASNEAAEEMKDGATADKAEAGDEEEGPKKNAAEVARDAISTYNEAVKLHLSGHLSEAIEEYKTALEANPELSQAHCNLGLIYNQQHAYPQAVQEFRKALAIDPKDAITYNGIGAALRAQNDQEGAIKNWKTAISLDPRLATAHYNLGTVYELQKDYDKALEAYADAIKNDSRLGEAYYRTGLIYLHTKRTEEAKDMLSKAIKVSKNAEYSADARKRLALLEQGKVK